MWDGCLVGGGWRKCERWINDDFDQLLFRLTMVDGKGDFLVMKIYMTIKTKIVKEIN